MRIRNSNNQNANTSDNPIGNEGEDNESHEVSDSNNNR